MIWMSSKKPTETESERLSLENHRWSEGGTTSNAFLSLGGDSGDDSFGFERSEHDESELGCSHSSELR